MTANKKNLKDLLDKPGADAQVVEPVRTTTVIEQRHKSDNSRFGQFTNFLANARDSVSNSIAVWENVPKYFFTPAQVRKLRDQSGRADPFTWNYKFQGMDCHVVISPARIRQPDGTFLDCFPGVTEELVEEALKKLLAQGYGTHNGHEGKTWVSFSLSMLVRELASVGRSRNIKEIKRAIEVMSESVIKVYADGEHVWTGPILSNLTKVDRAQYLKDSEAMHLAQLPVFITDAINKLEFRQFDYARLMQCDLPLSRALYKRLIHNFTYASTLKPMR